MKRMRDEKGFGLPHVLLLVIVVGLVVFVGWRVSDLKNSKTTTSSASQSSTTETVDRSYTMPKGFTVAKLSDSTISIAYPTDWGTLGPVSKANEATFTDATTLTDVSIGSEKLDGTLRVSLFPLQGFSIIAAKYGATVEAVKNATGYSWKVVSVNPADTTDKVGDTVNYHAITTKQGLTAYDFTWSDEGTNHSRWVVLTPRGFLEIDLPAELQAGDRSDTGASELDLYKATSGNILNSVSTKLMF